VWPHESRSNKIDTKVEDSENGSYEIGIIEVKYLDKMTKDRGNANVYYERNDLEFIVTREYKRC